MAKTYVSDYVEHCMKFYARYKNPIFCNEVDRINWNTCDKALSKLTSDKRELAIAIYKDVSSTNIKSLAKQNNMTDGEMWRFVKQLERHIAKERGLI
nr:MAG TPA: Sigma-70, region 4 [Caudoviricetes sp.]